MTQPGEGASKSRGRTEGGNVSRVSIWSGTGKNFGGQGEGICEFDRREKEGENRLR